MLRSERKYKGHILSCSECSRSDLGMLWECSEDGLEMLWRCSGNALGCFDNALGVLWVIWTQGTFLWGLPGSFCIFEVFIVSRDTQSNLGFSRTKPLFPDVMPTFKQKKFMIDLNCRKMNCMRHTTHTRLLSRKFDASVMTPRFNCFHHGVIVACIMHYPSWLP